MRKAFIFLLKAAISGLLLYFSLDLVNYAAVKERLAQASLPWLALELGVLMAQAVLVAMRWRAVLMSCGVALTFPEAFRFNMISVFFGQLLPSSVGGDGIRVWLVGRRGHWRGAAYAALLDRVVGVLGLAALVIVCLPWSLRLIQNPTGKIALLAIGFGSIAAGAAFIALGWDRLGFLRHTALTRHLAEVARVGLAIVRAPSVFAQIFSLSVLNHILVAMAAWCGAQAISADVSLLYAIFLVPPVMLVTVLPVSIAGWGLREGAMVAAFSYIGLPQSDGLVVSLLLGGSYLALGLIGCAIWLTTTDRLAAAPRVS